MRLTAAASALARWWQTAALLAYGVVLWQLRPRTPFEWDEVLFLQALDQYDVALHQPHPPGYPLYVVLGKLVRLVVGDPVRALQLLSVLATLATLALVWRLARQLDLPAWPSRLAVTMVALTPTVLFHANVGFSDLPGVALALAAAALLVAALEGPDRFLWRAGLLAAAAAAVRPQLALALVPLGVAAVVRALKDKRWRALAGGLVGGTTVSLLCWVPAVLITGPGRFRQALIDAGNWLAEKETTGRLPGAPLGVTRDQWFVFPFGTPALAIAFWLLVVLGAVALWRSGRRRLVLVAGGSGMFYLVAALFTMHYAESVRYELPALPFLALLAGGVAVAPGRWLRGALGAGVVAWGTAAAVWLAPVLALRHREPAPVWESLTWVAENTDPRLVTVVFDGAIKPHVAYLLRARGYRTNEKREAIAYANFVPDGAVVYVTRDARASGEVLLTRAWAGRALPPLTRMLYERCVVTRNAPEESVRFSSDFRVTNTAWELRGRGELSLPTRVPMQLVHVVAGDRALAVQLGHEPGFTVGPGAEAFVPLAPGTAGPLAVAVVGGGTTLFPGLDLLPVRGEDWRWLTQGAGERELVVPTAAHASGRLQTLWITDVLVRNQDTTHALTLTVELAEQRGQEVTLHARPRTVAAGASALLRDLVARTLGTTGGGGLRLRSDRPFLALWRTYNQTTPHTFTDPVFLPAFTVDEALASGTLAPLVFRPGKTGVRSNLGLFNPAETPVVVELARVGGGPLARPTVRLAAGGSWVLDGERLLGLDWRSRADEFAVTFRCNQPAFAFISVIENDSNRVTYVFPAAASERRQPARIPR
jgi:4-amino-4-deoxy-L-arabinose transferase-like glycosyltransferase